MKICIINTSDTQGGAAIAAYRLHTGLNSIGHDSRMIVREKTSNDDKVYQPEVPNDKTPFSYTINNIKKHYIYKNRSELSNTLFSLPYPGFDLSALELIKQADIVNLHWVNNFQSIENIGKLLSSGKTVVWTLHDQWPFTGGCH